MGFKLSSAGGDQTFPGAFCSDVLLVANINANQNNFAPSNGDSLSYLNANTWVLAASAAFTISGIAGGLNGRLLTIVNASAFSITLANESGSSTAANRMNFAVVLAPGESVTMEWLALTNRWGLLNVGRVTASGTGALIGFQVLTGSGNYAPNPAAHSGFADGCGAGGGGGACDGTGATLIGAGGGGSGARFRKFLATLVATPYACGALGLGGAAGPNNGANGGDTTFGSGGSIITAPGGLGGAFGNAATLGALPGLGAAIATGADINIGGQDGCFPYQDGLGTGAVLASGAGAQCPDFGGGGRMRTTDGAGNPATGFGAGGGGAYSTSATDRAGGNGGAGIIVVWEFA